MTNHELMQMAALMGGPCLGSVAWDAMEERERSDKVVDFAAARARLRPPQPGSIAAMLRNIDQFIPA